MKTLPDLPTLWQQYFLEPVQPAGADSWAIAFMARDQQQLFVSLANPFSEEHEEIFVAAVSDADLTTFVGHYKARFLTQLPLRFGLYRPAVDRVLTEYPDWQTFYEAWLQADPALIQGNLPLLFDFPNDQEYRAMRLKDADYAGYQRLLVVLYQYRKQQFQRVFIKSVDEATFAALRQQMLQLYQRVMPQLLLPDVEAARA